MKNLRQNLGLLALILLGFLITLPFVFPVDALLRRYAVRAEETLEAEIDWDSAHYAFPLGLTFSNLSFQKNSPRRISPEILLDSLEVQPHLLAFLTGGRGADYEIRAFGGRIRGEFDSSGEGKRLVFDAKDLMMESIPGMAEALPWRVLGDLSSKGELILDETGASGRVNFTLENGQLIDFQFMGMVLPPMELGAVGGRFVVSRSNVRLEDFELARGDLAGTVTGEVMLMSPMSASLLNLRSVLRLSPSYTEESLPPELQSQLGVVLRDGAIRMRLTGSMESVVTQFE